MLKSLGPIERNFCGHGKNDLESTCMCIQLNNPVVFFQIYKHKRYEWNSKQIALAVNI